MSIKHPSRRAKAAAGLVLLVLLAGGGCASVPYQEMSDARQAIDSAQAVVAGEPGPRAQVAEAQALLERAEAHLRAGEYDAARRTAERARALAIEAREEADSGNE
ncbi:MAG: DUF4398 domain-containing protein [Halofilum sp. (in: g-proteobacteria)]|nr:DUF4398 domain-containing protein [Halofilum sp. (in: g-proteobacteria)]